IPPATGRRFLDVPGKVGTTLAMSASIASDQASEQRLLEAVDVTVVLNEAAKQILIANGAAASTIVVNRLGLTLDRARIRKQPATARPVRFAFVGRFHPTKG